MKLTLALCLLLLATPALAQSPADAVSTVRTPQIQQIAVGRGDVRWLGDQPVTDALAWGRPGAADGASWALVGSAISAPCAVTRTRECVKQLAVSEAAAVGAAQVTKWLVKRTRPDWSADDSFFSMHTAVACAAALRLDDKRIGLAACAATGYLRVAGRKHWWTDAAVGAAVGYLSSRIR
jgi:membrane-associated phospholipid phosphatase